MYSSQPRLSRRSIVTGAAALTLASLIGAERARAETSAMVTENSPQPLRDPSTYRAYVPAASKTNQFAHYTCEFDASWAVMKTYGVDASLEEQLDIIGVDRNIEPYYVENEQGVFVYGGDISRNFCGDYETNFLARSRGSAMRRVFKEMGLPVRTVKDRKEIEQCLDRDRLIWIKTTVDFKPWVQATWVTHNGKEFPVVLGNDHALIVMGYDDNVVVIRDVLGPTSSNWERPYEYEVPWEQFLTCWAAQGSDGLAVGAKGSF
jgi:hypothetical protein